MSDGVPTYTARSPLAPAVIAVTLNPAIDVTVLARELHLGAVNRVESGGRLPGGKGGECGGGVGA